MRNTLLICAVLALLGCATPEPPSLPARLPLPSAVTSPPPASTEGHLSESLQTGHNALRQDLAQWLLGTLKDLEEVLNRVKLSPPPTEPAKRSY